MSAHTPFRRRGCPLPFLPHLIQRLLWPGQLTSPAERLQGLWPGHKQLISDYTQPHCQSCRQPWARDRKEIVPIGSRDQQHLLTLRVLILIFFNF
jgi:hypothetical protein